MVEQNMPENNGKDASRQPWSEQLLTAYRTPLGLIGACITTVFCLLTLFGFIAHMTGSIENPYTSILTIFLFPAGMLLGLLLIPLALVFQKKKIMEKTLLKEDFIINLSNPLHRKTILLVIILTCVNIVVFSVAAYEGYHYMDTPEFCGVVCHEIMIPEYTTYQQSPHSNVICVKCHIAPGVTGLLRAKLSGVRQLKGVLVGDYQSPVPVPVHELPAAEGTCENCHAPRTYIGEKVKKFVHYDNDDQTDPEEIEIALNVGGLNPNSATQEGIHWHVMDGLKIEYLPLNEERTQIGTVRMTTPDGEVIEYLSDSEEEEGAPHEWRTMDCTDCHNRPAHVYEDLEMKVDSGFAAEKLDPEIEGLREDSLTVLQKEYASREEAAAGIKDDLFKLQEERHSAEFVSENMDSLASAALFLKEAYLRNIWPEVGITWGTYKSHLGHQFEDEGYGCFRCHDDSHESEDSEHWIAQDCDLCHAEPE